MLIFEVPFSPLSIGDQNPKFKINKQIVEICAANSNFDVYFWIYSYILLKKFVFSEDETKIIKEKYPILVIINIKC